MINIAVMGYGTVGSGVVEVIDTNGERIAQRIGDALNVKYVLDIRDFPEDPIQEKIIHDFETIISDDEIQIVVEVMGGIEPAYTFVKRSLLAGKCVVTSMNEETPGVDMFKKDMYILKGGNIASKMRQDVKAMAKVANKLLAGESVGSADEEGYFPRGIRHQVWLSDGKPAYERMVDMLVKKLNGQPFETELPIPKLDRVPIAPAIKDLSKARIALLNTGGIVPVDNPDHIQSASATRWGRYDVSNMERLKGGEFKTIHAGFDPAAADADPNVITPIDALKVLEKEGVYGSLHPYFYTTVGTGTTEAEAARMAKEIIPYLQEDHVDGVIMVST